jgi:hypothetical protein
MQYRINLTMPVGIAGASAAWLMDVLGIMDEEILIDNANLYKFRLDVTNYKIN